MQFHHLRYALEIYTQGSFSAAAKALFITQPTLSQQIIALEQEVGVKLFIRHPRGVSLTDAGEEFISYARRILNEMDSLGDSMRSYAALSKGKVKVGVLWVFANLGIAELITGFKEAYPAIETLMTVNGSVRLVEMLHSREVDAIFFIGTALDLTDDIYKVKLFESDMTAVMPAGHRLAAQTQVRIEDLAGENIVMPSEDSTLYTPIHGFFQSAGISPKVVAQSSQTDVTMACAASGMGIAFVSSTIAYAHQSDAVAVRPLQPGFTRTVYYATLSSTLVIPAVRLLTDFIEAVGPQSGK